MLADAVRANRRRLGLTQEQLADAAGLSVRSIGKLEAGRIGTPRPVTVQLLADAFGLTGTERASFCRTATNGQYEPTNGLPVPAQLPLDVAGFAARHHELACLDELLRGAGPDARTPVVIAISGTAGVGKTALAVHWAHQIRHRFPDGQLYVNLRGYGPDRPMGPDEALVGFLRALGVPEQQIPVGAEERAARYRTQIADRRTLVVLDNARDADQVRPLLPGTAGCVALVTSRTQLSSLVATSGARPLGLELLTTEDSRQLLEERLGADRVAAEPEAVDQIIARSAGLPIALAIVAAHITARPRQPVRDIARQLAGGRSDHRQGDHDLLADPDPATDIRALFSWSYQAIPAEPARLFRLLGLHPGPELAIPAAASLAAVPEPVAAGLLTDLARASLVAERGHQRYTCHDLLRAYARELAHTIDTDQQRRAAVGHLLDHYRLATSMAMDTIYPGEWERRPQVPRQRRAPATRGRIGSLPADALPPELQDPAAAAEWLDAELPNVLAAARHAAGHGWAEHAWHLSTIMHRYLREHGRYEDAELLHSRALATARAAGDRVGELTAMICIGQIHWLQDRRAQAIAEFGQASEIARAIGNRTGRSDALTGLGWLSWSQGRHDEAIAHLQPALEIARAAGHRVGEADALLGLGWVHLRQGNSQQAAELLGCAIGLARVTGYRDLEPYSLVGLGYIHFEQGQRELALADFRRALEIAHTISKRDGQMYALLGMAYVHRNSGEHRWALQRYGEVFEIARTIGNHDTAQEAMTALQELHQLLDGKEPAEAGTATRH